MIMMRKRGQSKRSLMKNDWLTDWPTPPHTRMKWATWLPRRKAKKEKIPFVLIEEKDYDNDDEPEEQFCQKVPIALVFESSNFASCNVFIVHERCSPACLLLLSVSRYVVLCLFPYIVSIPLSSYLSPFYTWIRVCAMALLGRLFGFCFVASCLVCMFPRLVRAWVVCLLLWLLFRYDLGFVWISLVE